VKAGPIASGEGPGGNEAQESYAPVPSLNRWYEWRTLKRSKALKAVRTPRGQRRRKRRTAAREEESSEGLAP